MSEEKRVQLDSLENAAGIDPSGAATDGYGQRVAAKLTPHTVPPTHTVNGVRDAAWSSEEYYARLEGPPRRRKTPLPKPRSRPANFCHGLDQAVEAWEFGADRDRETYVINRHHDPETCEFCSKRLAGTCSHCHLDPARAKEICRWCADWRRTHQGQLPPPEVVERRRARRERSETQ